MQEDTQMADRRKTICGIIKSVPPAQRPYSGSVCDVPYRRPIYHSLIFIMLKYWRHQNGINMTLHPDSNLICCNARATQVQSLKMITVMKKVQVNWQHFCHLVNGFFAPTLLLLTADLRKSMAFSSDWKNL